LKIADGANRARPPVMVAGLRRLGVDVTTLAPLVEEKIMGHGRQVGVVRSIAP
jgi:L-asparaginase II